LSKLVLKAGCAALALCVVSSDVAVAQSTNGIPIVPRKHRYSGRVQLLGGTATELPPPPPSDEDMLIKEQNDGKLVEDVKTKDSSMKLKMPPRRSDPRRAKEDMEKEREKNPFTSLFITDSSVTNKANPEMKKFGWLAEETDLNRQRLEAIRKPTPEQASWTNSLADNAKTNETKRTEVGSLKANVFEPLGGARAVTGTTTANVARVVDDHVARGAEKRRQDDAKDKAAKKEGLNMAEKNDMPTLLTTTNVTLGLSRSRKDDAQADTVVDNDFSLTRKAMADITGRYQLGLNMADVVHRPSASAADSATTKAGSSRVAYDREGAAGRVGEARRPAAFGEDEAGTTTAAKSPTSPTATGGPAWFKTPAGKGESRVSASSMVEGPKMLKVTDAQPGSRFVAPQPANTPFTVPITPAYVPGSVSPSFAPGNHTPGSLTPSFKPTTPYKSLFDTPSSR
jgi:hypothetical protein